MSQLFFRALYQIKNYVIPHTVLGRHLEYFKTQKTTITPNTTTVENYSENYRKKVINCNLVEFCFKMAAILDTF